MNKLKYSIATGLVMLIMTYSQITHAACSVVPVHLSKTTNVHVTRYGENYPYSRGDFRISGTATFTCSWEMTGIRITGSNILSKTTDTQGYDAWRLPDTGQQASVFGIEPSVKLSALPETTYADATQPNTGGNITGGGYLNIDLVTVSKLVMPGNTSTVTYNIPEPVAYVSFGLENYSTNYPAIYLDSLTLNFIETSCGIKAKQGSTINWPNLYKADIVNGTAESKPYNLSLICGDASAPPLPINISFSSTNGFADAANGIVKTNLGNLGLKLSWADPALPPLVLDQVNHSMLSGVGDYTVMAKPVKISKAADTLQAGQFDTTVTMNIEFE